MSKCNVFLIYRKIVNRVSENMFFVNRVHNKPLMWSKIILKETLLQQNLEVIFENLIDPRSIYLENSLTEDEINIFKQNLLELT
jgi:hypothetical protein